MLLREDQSGDVFRANSFFFFYNMPGIVFTIQLKKRKNRWIVRRRQLSRAIIKKNKGCPAYDPIFDLLFLSIKSADHKVPSLRRSTLERKMKTRRSDHRFLTMKSFLLLGFNLQHMTINNIKEKVDRAVG